MFPIPEREMTNLIRVVRLESSGGILGANQRKMTLDRKHFSFIVQVIDRGHFNAAGGYAEGRVLDSLEFLNKRH